MKLDAKLCDSLTEAGKMSLEEVVMAGQSYWPRMLSYYGGEFHIGMIDADAGWDGRVAACTHLLMQGAPIDIIALTVDVLGIATPSGFGSGHKAMADGAGIIPGSLNKLWKAGDPRVMECLNLTIVSLDKNFYVTCPYKRRDKDVLWTGEDQIIEDAPLDGPMAQLLIRTIQESHDLAS